jgi:hypothetical protein
MITLRTNCLDDSTVSRLEVVVRKDTGGCGGVVENDEVVCLGTRGGVSEEVLEGDGEAVDLVIDTLLGAEGRVAVAPVRDGDGGGDGEVGKGPVDVSVI